MGFTTLTVSVPEGKEADLLRFAALLAGPLAVSTIEGPEEPDGGDPGHRTGRRRWGWGRSSVRDAYFGGVSNVWRPFLEYLAERPDEWVSWHDLCDHIQRTPREASGMLGAAERRCGGRPPYEKKWEGTVRYFRMPAQLAELIKEAASEEE
jgi:hypothetical protein